MSVRVGLDLDGVIVDSIGTWLRLLREGGGFPVAPDAYPEPYANPEMAAFCDLHEVEMLIAPRPVPGAVEAVTSLKAAGHDLVVITARGPRVRRLTEAWLDYYGLPVDDLHFLAGGNKGEAARRAGVSIFVEDAPSNAIALAAARIPVLLFATPYNRRVRHPLVRSCDGWPSVLEAIANHRAHPARRGAPAQA